MKTSLFRIVIAALFILVIYLTGYQFISREIRGILKTDICHKGPKIEQPKIKFIRINNLVAEPTPYELPDSISCFVRRYGLGRYQYISLLKDSVYQVQVNLPREKFISDNGKWVITKKGYLALKSNINYQNILVDSNYYLRVDSNSIKQLPSVKASLVSLLTKSKADSFSYLILKHYCPNLVWFAKGERIKRGNLAKVINKIDCYLKWDGKNVFYFKPVTYKGYITILELDNLLYANDQQIEEVSKYIDLIPNNISGGFCPYIAYSKE
jgi:hypothetical protein